MERCVYKSGSNRVDSNIMVGPHPNNILVRTFIQKGSFENEAILLPGGPDDESQQGWPVVHKSFDFLTSSFHQIGLIYLKGP